MDSSQFLSYFWGLSNENTNEQITKSAESIVNLIEYEQKIGGKEKEAQCTNMKFRLYFNICENPTEDILYTIKRLIGGIASTGIESRRGFLLTFNLMVEKFSNLLNFNELVHIIERETIVSKSEKNHIKNCQITGKIMMLKPILEVRTITADVMLHIFRILCDMLSHPMYQIAEEAILNLINEFFKKSAELGFYTEFENGKKYGRFLERLFTLFGKVFKTRIRFENLKKLSEISLFFILSKYQIMNSEQPTGNNLTGILSQTIKSFFNLNEDFLSNLGNYFKSVLAKNVRDNEFHMSFELLLDHLRKVTDNKKVYSIWNLLIDETLQQEMKVISLKNYQLLVFNFSKFILQNFFVLNYVKEIFDASFFENMLKFSSTKKFKYINGLIEILTSQLSKAKENGQVEAVSTYSFNLLGIFGADPLKNLSVQTYKNFFIFLFNNLDDGKKINFVEKQSKVTQEESEKESEVEYEDFLYRLTALKQLMISREAVLDEGLKHKILEYFLTQNFDNSLQKFDVELESLIEDRLLLVIFAYFRIESISSNETSAKAITLPDKKVVKSLMKVNKILQKMVKSNTLEGVDLDDFKVYAQFYKKFAALVPVVSGKTKATEENTNTSSQADNERLYSILKLALIVLIMFLKNPEEYNDILSDLLEITKFDENWMGVYTDIIISLLHKGNNTLADWAMNNFRKMSKVMNKQSFNIISEFLTQSDTAKTTKGTKKEEKMFDDLNGDEASATSDVEMES